MPPSFAEIRYRSERGWRAVASLFCIVAMGRKPARDFFRSLAEEQARAVMADGHEDTNLLRMLRPDFETEVGHRSAEELSEAGMNALFAAAVVFAHSIIDSAVDDLLAIIVSGWPAQEFGEEEVRLSIKDLTSVSVAQDCMEKARAKTLSKLCGRGLPEKIQRIFDHCKPTRTGFTFQPEMLKQFDALRHEIVHGEGLGTPMRREALDIVFSMEKMEKVLNEVLDLLEGAAQHQEGAAVAASPAPRAEPSLVPTARATTANPSGSEPHS